MIGSVRGTVLERTATGEVLVEVGGVGYRVLVPLGAMPQLDPGAPAFLFTHLHVRDDAMVLYGFPTSRRARHVRGADRRDRVGPKLALAILSVHSPNALRRCLADDDLDALCSCPASASAPRSGCSSSLKARLEVPDLDLARCRSGGAVHAREARCARR